MPSSGPIQTAAPGLLGLLQLKNQGRLPSQILEEVRAIIDIWPLYLQSDVRASHVQSAAITTGANLLDLFSVDSQVMWVHEYSCWAALGAGDMVSAACLTLIDPVVSTLHHPLPGAIFQGSAGGEPAGPNNAFFLSCGGFWVNSGGHLGALFYSSLAGSSFVGDFNLRYTPIDI
jgi:hypothetical protein